MVQDCFQTWTTATFHCDKPCQVELQQNEDYYALFLTDLGGRGGGLQPPQPPSPVLTPMCVGGVICMVSKPAWCCILKISCQHFKIYFSRDPHTKEKKLHTFWPAIEYIHLYGYSCVVKVINAATRLPCPLPSTWTVIEWFRYFFQTHSAPNPDSSYNITHSPNDGQVSLESTFITVSHIGAPHTHYQPHVAQFSNKWWKLWWKFLKT